MDIILFCLQQLFGSIIPEIMTRLAVLFITSFQAITGYFSAFCNWINYMLVVHFAHWDYIKGKHVSINLTYLYHQRQCLNLYSTLLLFYCVLPAISKISMFIIATLIFIHHWFQKVNIDNIITSYFIFSMPSTADIIIYVDYHRTLLPSNVAINNTMIKIF